MKKSFLWAALLSAAICLGGCASQAYGSGSVSSEASDVPDVLDAPPAVDWQTQTFPVNEQIEDGSALSVTDFSLWEHENPGSDEDFFYGTDGTSFYTLEFGFQSQAAEDICLSIYGSGGSSDRVVLSSQALAEDPSSLYVTAASMILPDEFSFQVTSLCLNEKGKICPEKYRVIRMSCQGEILSDVDVMPLYESQGLFSSDTFSLVEDCILDGDGCIYTRSRGRILIADAAGSLLMEKDCGDGNNVVIGDPAVSDDGRLIFPVMDGGKKTVRLVWFDTQNAEEHTLAELEYLSFQKLYAMRGRHVYYGTREGIIDWDTESGRRWEIFRYKDNAIPSDGNTMLAFDGEGNPLLRVVYEEEDMLLVLGEREAAQGAVRVADLSGSRHNLLGEDIAAYSRRNPLYCFSYEKAEAGMEEDFRDRVMAELVSGAGPDILYLSREDLVSLQGKGALADLEELISQDTLRELLPGAVGLGRVDGVLAGIPGEVCARTVFTYPEIWGGGSWSINDILGLVQSGVQGGPVEAVLPTASGSGLYYLALLDLEHSAFIDWENNTCSFHTGGFASLLETLKAYSTDETLIQGSEWEMLRQGKCLGVPVDITGFYWYELYHGKYGENIKAAGFPSETGNGSYLAADGILAVNADTAHREAVSAFLEYVLGVQGQGYCSEASVRKNMITEDMVFYDDENNPCLKLQDDPSHQLVVKADGTFYIRQYNEFMESCVPLPEPYEELQSIISQEADAFFCGEKTAEEAAEIIQSRVQLYLDEHN